MDILIQSPHTRVSNRVDRIVFEKFERLEKIFDRIVRCEVVLRKEKSASEEGYRVEARLIIPGNDLFAKERGPKFEVAAENACLDLERQLKKRKTKLSARNKARKVNVPINEEELE